MIFDTFNELHGEGRDNHDLVVSLSSALGKRPKAGQTSSTVDDVIHVSGRGPGLISGFVGTDEFESNDVIARVLELLQTDATDRFASLP